MSLHLTPAQRQQAEAALIDLWYVAHIMAEDRFRNRRKAKDDPRLHLDPWRVHSATDLQLTRRVWIELFEGAMCKTDYPAPWQWLDQWQAPNIDDLEDGGADPLAHPFYR